jgi:GDP-4-dehydro-6-deoxy-D-mannose reductase
MRILVTGATGFVGGWLVQELEDAGHEVVASVDQDRLDVTDRAAVEAGIAAARPDAIAHMAGVSFGPEAGREPARALAVNVGGTINVVQALGSLGRPAILLVPGSSEVYGQPDPEDLPLAETAPIRPRAPYALTKAAQEAIALRLGPEHGIRVVACRSFNHTGPGQRLDFAIPAFASRILAAQAAGERRIRVGNVDVRRDIGDVRDVARAYRLLLELAHDGGTPAEGLVANVATGTSVAMRDAIARLSAAAGYSVELDPDPGLIRSDDAPDVRGDSTRLRELTGWRPEIPLEQTLIDIVADLRARA